MQLSKFITQRYRCGLLGFDGQLKVCGFAAQRPIVCIQPLNSLCEARVLQNLVLGDGYTP